MFSFLAAAWYLWGGEPLWYSLPAKVLFKQQAVHCLRTYVCDDVFYLGLEVENRRHFVEVSNEVFYSAEEGMEAKLLQRYFTPLWVIKQKVILEAKKKAALP